MLNLQEWEKSYKLSYNENSPSKEREIKKIIEKNGSVLRKEHFSTITAIQFNRKRLKWFTKLAKNSDDPRLYQRIEKIRKELGAETKTHLDILELMEKYDLHLID